MLPLWREIAGWEAVAGFSLAGAVLHAAAGSNQGSCCREDETVLRRGNPWQGRGPTIVISIAPYCERQATE